MTTRGDDGLHMLEFNLRPNEASGLISIENESLLGMHGWEFGFWVVLDEGEIEDCVGAIGHRRGADIQDGWEIDRFHCEPNFVGDGGKTEDAEAVTRHDGMVYVFGSHFGSKDGPLQAKRGFVARFREADIQDIFEDPVAGMEISRQSFVLHRLINDALKEKGPDLIPLGPKSRKAFIRATIERGGKKGKKWAGLVREDDYPINVEGAAFRKEGSLLLGLRFPVSADGRPVLVELEGIERLFEPGGDLPEVRGFWVVDAVGRDGDLAGVRDLGIFGSPEESDGEELHLVTGNVDSRDKGSILLQDYPGGQDTVATHFRCTLPQDEHSGTLKGEFVREFPDLPRVEGIAITEGDRFFYVTDEDEGVHLRLTRMLAEE